MKDAYINSFFEELEKIAGPGLGLGGTDTCVCPNCGYKTSHRRGVPCNKMSCPKCGTPMVGLGMPQTGKGQQ